MVYKQFERSLHVGLLDPTCVQKCRPVPLTVFGFSLWSNSRQILGVDITNTKYCSTLYIGMDEVNKPHST